MHVGRVSNLICSYESQKCSLGEKKIYFLIHPKEFANRSVKTNTTGLAVKSRELPWLLSGAEPLPLVAQRSVRI